MVEVFFSEALFSNDCETAFNSIEQDINVHHSNIS
jgi:hypothetical protein